MRTGGVRKEGSHTERKLGLVETLTEHSTNLTDEHQELIATLPTGEVGWRIKFDILSNMIFEHFDCIVNVTTLHTHVNARVPGLKGSQGGFSDLRPSEDVPVL